MNIYGVKIDSDLSFSASFPGGATSFLQRLLSANVPAALKRDLAFSFPLYCTHGRKVYLSSDREFGHTTAGQPWCYDVLGVLRFYWQSGEKHIYYEFDESGSPELLCFWFVHLLLPFYLSLEGVCDFLHAGAVSCAGKLILFIAPSMGGKSTLVDYCLKQGDALVADDKVPMFMEDGRVFIAGAHPYHRPYRQLEVLGDYAVNFEMDCQPIHAFYILDTVAENANVDIEEVRGVEKFEFLHPNYLYATPLTGQESINSLTVLLQQAPMFRLKIPWNLERLPEVYSALNQHRFF